MTVRDRLRTFKAGDLVSYELPMLQCGGIRNGWRVNAKKRFSFLDDSLTFIVYSGEPCVVLSDCFMSPVESEHLATFLFVRNEIIVYFEHCNYIDPIWGLAE